MGILKELADGAAASAEIVRSVKMLDAGGDDLPQCDFLLAYVPRHKLNELTRKLAGRVTDIYEEPKYRRLFFGATFRGAVTKYVDGREVPGITKQNIRRMSEFFLLRAEAYEQLPDMLVLDDKDEIERFACLIDSATFRLMVNEALSLEDFARDLQEREKKDSEPTSDSL